MPVAPAPRHLARALLVLLGATFALLAAAAPAHADPPSRLPQPITDTAGVLDDEGVQRIDTALDRLYDERGVQLWVVYVESFDGVAHADWATRTAEQSDFGDNDALLAVATGDRAYALWLPGSMTAVSDGEFAHVEGAAESALRSGDWAGAAVAAPTVSARRSARAAAASCCG